MKPTGAKTNDEAMASTVAWKRRTNEEYVPTKMIEDQGMRRANATRRLPFEDPSSDHKL